MSQVHQKRYNLMIIGEAAIKKLDSLPERHKGMYVSEVIAEKLKQEDDALSKAASLIVPNHGNYTKASFETYLRQIIRDELKK